MEVLRERDERRSYGYAERYLADIHDTLQQILALQVAVATHGKSKHKPVYAPRPGQKPSSGKRSISPRELAMMHAKGR